MKRLLSLILLTFALWASVAFAGGPEYSPSPWMVYVGAYGGFYSADFLYSSQYYSMLENSYIPHTNDAFQEGALGGAQVGFQYHFSTPYFLGMVFSYTLNSNKAYLTKTIDDNGAVLELFDNDHSFRVNYNLDLAALFGFDLTSQTHVYAKVGASYARLMHTLAVFLESGVASPRLGNYRSESKYLWGFVLGLGLVHDISKWINVFAEYDHYSYPNRNLNSRDNIRPEPSLAVFSPFADSFTQQIRTTANAVRFGVNVKFMDAFSAAFYGMPSNSCWSGYLGVFSAYSAFDFAYNSTYFSNLPGNTILNNNSFQQAYSIGGQLGGQYHFRSPYFLGLVFSVMTNNGRAYLVQPIDSNAPPGFQGFDLRRTSRVDYNLDLAMLIGADITSQTHAYFKLGTSYAGLTQQLATTLARNAPTPVIGFQQTEHEDLWGWVAGLGITHDISKWVNVFAEYAHYLFPDISLQTLNNISPTIGGAQRDLLPQRVGLSANSVRVGLNVKFGDSFSPMKYNPSINSPLLFYLGIFGGYYSADFGYEGNTSSNRPSNRSFGNDAFQQSYSIGGQLGGQYHFQRSPYFVGLVFSGAHNGDKARLIEFINVLTSLNLQSINLEHEFRIRYNLDLAFVIGADITSRAHAYLKLGFSYADFRHLLSVYLGDPIPDTVAPPVVSTRERQDVNFYGWLAGLGLTYDLGKRVNLFMEYTHYNYYRNTLNTLNNFSPNFPAGGADRLTQSVFTTANAVRMGLNLKFET